MKEDGDFAFIAAIVVFICIMGIGFILWLQEITK